MNKLKKTLCIYYRFMFLILAVIKYLLDTLYQNSSFAYGGFCRVSASQMYLSVFSFHRDALFLQLRGFLYPSEMFPEEHISQC